MPRGWIPTKNVVGRCPFPLRGTEGNLTPLGDTVHLENARTDELPGRIDPNMPQYDYVHTVGRQGQGWIRCYGHPGHAAQIGQRYTGALLLAAQFQKLIWRLVDTFSTPSWQRQDKARMDRRDWKFDCFGRHGSTSDE